MVTESQSPAIGGAAPKPPRFGALRQQHDEEGSHRLSEEVRCTSPMLLAQSGKSPLHDRFGRAFRKGAGTAVRRKAGSVGVRQCMPPAPLRLAVSAFLLVLSWGGKYY